MNWKDHEKTLFPSFEEGSPRRSSQMQRYLKLGAAGEVKQLLQQRSDLPRCALFKVARHLFKGRCVPSSKEGNRPLFNFQWQMALTRRFARPSPKGRGSRQQQVGHFGHMSVTA